MFVAVSERFVEAFRNSGLSGLEFSDLPIDLIDCDLKYHVANVESTRIVIDEVVGCDVCRVMSLRRIERIAIDKNTWSGQDVFQMGSVFGVIIATQRFVDFVTNNGFTNFQFVHERDFRRDYSKFLG